MVRLRLYLARFAWHVPLLHLSAIAHRRCSLLQSDGDPGETGPPLYLLTIACQSSLDYVNQLALVRVSGRGRAPSLPSTTDRSPKKPRKAMLEIFRDCAAQQHFPKTSACELRRLCVAMRTSLIHPSARRAAILVNHSSVTILAYYCLAGAKRERTVRRSQSC
jgi:hypothetical protein